MRTTHFDWAQVCNSQIDLIRLESLDSRGRCHCLLQKVRPFYIYVIGISEPRKCCVINAYQSCQPQRLWNNI